MEAVRGKGRSVASALVTLGISIGLAWAEPPSALPPGPLAQKADPEVEGGTASSAATSRQTSALPKNRYEPTFLPAIGNDPDVGIKFGFFAQLAKYQDDLRPYAWRAQLSAVASVHEGPGGAEVPYRVVTLRFDLPSALGKGTRVFADAGYMRTTNLGYFGLGNGAVATRRWEGLEPGTDSYLWARRFNQYDGSTSDAGIGLLYDLGPAWRFLAGLRGRWSQMTPYPGSLLAEDVRSAASGTRQISGLGESFYPLLTAGVVYDTRDHETVPTAGAFHEAIVRCSPGGRGDGGWCGATLALRGYLQLAGPRLTLAGRILGDVLFGRPPIIELARYGGMLPAYGPGGMQGVRGLPEGRLHGNTKLIGNLELRSFFWKFRVAGQRLELGAAAFLDVGRVWTNSLAGVSGLDGSGLALHYGVGAGIRLRWGDSLVIRFDMHYSPAGAQLGSPVGLCVDVDPVL